MSLLLTNRGISTKHQHTVFTFGDALRCRPVCGARNSPKFRNRRKECSSRIRRKRPEEESLSYVSRFLQKFRNSVLFSTSKVVVSPRIIKSPISSTLLDTRKLSTRYTREYSESQSRNEKKKNSILRKLITIRLISIIRKRISTKDRKEKTIQTLIVRRLMKRKENASSNRQLLVNSLINLNRDSYNRPLAPPLVESIYQTHATPIGPKASEADGTKVATHSENTCSSATWSFGYTHGHGSTPSYVCLYDVDKHTRTLLPFSLSLSLFLFILRSARG